MTVYDAIPKELWYLAFASIMLFLVLVFIPKNHIRALMPTCLLWGGPGSILFNVATAALGLLEYRFMGPFVLLGSPLFVALAWPLGNMLFLYFRPKGTLEYALWLATFSSVSAGIDAVFHGLGLVTYYHWSPLARFFVALFWFGGGTALHDLVMRRRIKTV